MEEKAKVKANKSKGSKAVTPGNKTPLMSGTVTPAAHADTPASFTP